MTNKYTIDTAHSGIHFSVRHMVIAKVRGAFNKWSANIDLDDADLTRSKVDVTIEAASIDTRTADRDTHLRSPDFLDVEHFPTLTFRSTKVEKKSDDRYAVTGDLTIRGITHPVVLDTELVGRGKDPWGGSRIGFAARTSIERKQWDLKWNVALETGGVLVGERVDIEIEIEAVQAQTKAA